MTGYSSINMAHCALSAMGIVTNGIAVGAHPIVQHSFVEIDIFYGHSLPSADSRRALVSYWRKNVHNTG